MDRGTVGGWRIRSDSGVPKDEVWWVEPTGSRLEVEGGLVRLIESGKIVGKIVNVSVKSGGV